MQPVSRMYVDENGNNDLKASSDPNHRYLGLTGVICTLDETEKHVAPELEALKAKYFGSHPDNPIVLHRAEMMNKRPPFQALRDPAICQAFDDELFKLISKWEYLIVTVVIDKLAHVEKYTVWQADPYHYCLEVLIERYAMHMRKKSLVGDVIAESRGGKEDLRLKASFKGVYQGGTSHMDHNQLRSCLTSGELKVKTKANNIAGLQLADLVAHPSYKTMIAAHGGGDPPGPYGQKIAQLLEESKYRRSWLGRIEGYGRKWLP
jgi:hypothetical protein